jgi:c-di-GMP-binding flagellar brake protein YcgR
MIPLLQKITPTLKLNSSASASNIILFVVVIGGLAVLVLWILVASAKSRSGKPGSHSKGGFRKQARRLKLTKEQLKLLELIIAETKFPNPIRVLESSSALDKLLRFAMSHLEEQDLGAEEKEFRKSVIYGIKQTIEANSSQIKIISSTLSLPINTEVKIRGNDGVTHTSYITSNRQSMVGMELPAGKDSASSYPWGKGEALSVTFIRNGTDVYSYQTKVLGYKTVRGVPSVFTEHGKNLKQTQKRHSKRKEISKPVVMYQVNIMETTVKRKPVRQAVVNKARSLLGSLQDISAGGCSILSRNSLPQGSLVKIDFEPTRGKPVTVYGKIRGTSSSPPRGKIMHVQFTNVSRKNLNTIRDFVYEYDNVD